MKTINLKDLMSISGKSGLYRYIAQARNGVVVESLTDKKRHVAPPTARVSSMEDIAIFTRDGELSLADVFMKIHEKEGGKKSLDPKKVPGDDLKNSFSEILPDYDEERVYVSDIKKVYTWYNLLHELNLLEVIDAEEEEAEGDDKPGDDKKAEVDEKAESDQKPGNKGTSESGKKSGDEENPGAKK